MIKKTFFALLISLSSLSILCDENSWFVPLGLPPKASPRRISGGESFPPLPLPATPLRRSERKRPPSQPKLVGKIVWGETASFAYKDGISEQISDWNLCPDDVKQILNKINHNLGMQYSTEAVALSTFHADPEKTPILFLSGVRTVKFDKEQTNILRSYVLKGGILLCDSIAGSPYFYDSVKKMVEETFSEYQVRTVPPDHPIYHMIFDVDKVKYPQNLNSEKPLLEAVYVGSRIAVLISKYGLGCGWDNHDVPTLKQSIFYDVDSANKLGLNIISYAIGYSRIGLEEAKPELFGAIDQKPPTSEFIFAQIMHGGAWNVHPGAAAVLLRNLRQNTELEVNLKRLPVQLGNSNLTGLTFLYLSGLDIFVFNKNEISALKAFLNSSGTLFINNGLGLKTFDNAVRANLKMLFPEAELQRIPLEHPIYNNVFKIVHAEYTPAVGKLYNGLNVPVLEGISINGDLRIIYSPFDIEAGWLGIVPPLALTYMPDTAIQLGVNIITYSMTH